MTLTGTAEWQYQRDEAEFIAANILGVIDVLDEIELTGVMPNAGDVKSSIKDAFKRNAKIDAEDLTVETKNGTITLKGVVGSWSEHDEAISAAWAAPGRPQGRRQDPRRVLSEPAPPGPPAAARASCSRRRLGSGPAPLQCSSVTEHHP